MTLAIQTPPARPSVAIVEDEIVLREELAFQLEQLGFAVESFEGAAQLYRRLAVTEFAVVVLDIGLDGEDGLSICQHLRQHDKRTGILFVTARGLREDRLSGLDAGADAYLTKPVDIDELALILRRLAERSTLETAGSAPSISNTLPLAQWTLESGTDYLLAPNRKRIRISLNEQQLLKPLLENAGEVCSHRILATALGLLSDEYNKHRLEVIFSRLRERVAREIGVTLPLQTKRGVGYYFLND